MVIFLNDLVSKENTICLLLVNLFKYLPFYFWLFQSIYLILLLLNNLKHLFVALLSLSKSVFENFRLFLLATKSLLKCPLLLRKDEIVGLDLLGDSYLLGHFILERKCFFLKPANLTCELSHFCILLDLKLFISKLCFHEINFFLNRIHMASVGL